LKGIKRTIFNWNLSQHQYTSECNMMFVTYVTKDIL
jgi:hypothetical protein